MYKHASSVFVDEHTQVYVYLYLCVHALYDLHSLRYRVTDLRVGTPPYTQGYTPSQEAGCRVPKGQLSA